MDRDLADVTVEDLMAEIDGAWAEIADLVDGTSAAALSHPGPDGRAAKDILIHLAAWEGSLLALLDGASRAWALGIDPASYARMSVDDVNAVIFERNRGRPVADIVGEVRATHASVRERLGGLSDEDLFRPYSYYQPDDPPFNADPIINWIAANTFRHYRAHLPEIGERLVGG